MDYSLSSNESGGNKTRSYQTSSKKDYTPLWTGSKLRAGSEGSRRGERQSTCPIGAGPPLEKPAWVGLSQERRAWAHFSLSSLRELLTGTREGIRASFYSTPEWYADRPENPLLPVRNG